MTTTRRVSPLRHGRDAARVGTVELFYDLVYVFTITQLSHLLVEHTTVDGAVQAAVLLAMVWQAWVYTTWATTYLDPGRTPVRLMLLVLMLAGLVLAAALPTAFEAHGMLVAITWTAIQVGRALVAIVLLRGAQLQMVFLRLGPWSVLSGTVAIIGATTHGHAREALWASAILIDVVGGAVGFFVPGLGNSDTTDWTVNGGHFAERCQAFVLIALGESIIVVGRETPIDDATATRVGAFLAAFVVAIGLWWVYFDRVAEHSVRVIETSTDPGRLARSAFHYVHPLVVAGIIAAAASDEKLLEHPSEHGVSSTAWLILGGVGLYLAGHALFIAVLWRTVSWPRVGGIVVLAALGALAPHATALVLEICAVAVVVGVAVADRVTHPE